MTETKLPGMVINRIDTKSTYDSLVEKGEIGENDLCLVEDEDNISPGSGTDISLGVTGAAVGDIVKVKAVDDSGKPTAWEAAGNNNMPLIYHQTIEDEITNFTLETIDNVNIALSSVKIRAILKAVGATWIGFRCLLDTVSPNNEILYINNGGIYSSDGKWYAGGMQAELGDQVTEGIISNFTAFVPYINASTGYNANMIQSIPMFTYNNPPVLMTIPNAKIKKIEIYGTFSNLEVMIWGR